MREADGKPSSPWWLFERPRPLTVDRNLTRRLHLEFVTQGPRQWNRELELADELYQTYIAGNAPEEACQAFLNLFIRISDIHLPLQRANPQRSVPVLNTFQEHLAENLAIEHSKSASEAFRSALGQQAEALDHYHGPDAWYYPKVLNLAVKFEVWRRNYAWIHRMQERLHHTVAAADVAEIQESSQQMWSKIVEDRGYGIRNCFFISPLFLDHDQAQLVLDPELHVGDTEVRPPMLDNVFAILGVGEKPRFGQALKPDVEVYEDSSHDIKQYRVGVRGFNAQLFAVDDSGEIRTNPISYIPLRRVFEKEDAIGTFELWRLFLYMRLHDLTRRAELVDRLPSIDDIEKETVKGTRILGGLISKPIKKINYKFLVIPRLKPEEPESKTKDLEEEGSRRFVDRHHVTWFTRRLPKNYHASDRAKEYAKAHGVTLKPEETIVREHYRGKKTEDTSERATKAVFRSTDGS